ncbi:unnamed protein product, partial [Mesorhabditis belari]|uniref:Transmembrane protein n=1 Tax=Mesorhabditis belari TaxID=2138241 RepID=A0AAF3EDQ4_9BILA
MSKKLSRQETIDSALGVAFKISDVVGIDSKRIHDSMRKKSVKNDVEMGNKQAQKEAEEILKNAVEKKGEDREDREEMTLNNDHVLEILNYINKVKNDEEEKKKKVTHGCSVFLQLFLGLPFSILFIYIGYNHQNDCTLISKLPIWLIVLGVISAIRCALTVFSWIAWKAQSPETAGAVEALDKCCASANFIWTIYGCYLLWDHWNDYTYEDKLSPLFCDHSVMIVSKMVIALFYVESIDGALGAVYKITEMTGFETKSFHDSVRKKVDERKESKMVNDVEMGRSKLREETKQLLKEAVEKRDLIEGETSAIPILNNEQLQEVFKVLEEADEKKKTQEPEGNVNKVKKGMTIGAALVTLLIFGPMAVTIFLVGYFHEDECPIERMPNWLRISGLIWIASLITTLIDLFAIYKKSKSLQTSTERVNSIIRFMSFIWCCYGIYLIWDIWDAYVTDDSQVDTYCHPTVMLFSKIIIGLFITGWAIAGVILTCLCICLFLGC